MNNILVSHEERMVQKDEIIEGLKNKSLRQPQLQYYERERQRQKRENVLISQLKKVNKSFNQSELKKTFFSTALKIMHSYLSEDQKIKIQPEKINMDSINIVETEKYEKNSDYYVSIHPQVLPIKSEKQQCQSQQNLQKHSIIHDQDQFPNFYQTYINLFVNFFNIKAQQKPSLIKLDNIRSIIRPNNKFVIIDLLKALLQFARNDFRLLIKKFLNDQKIKQNYLRKKHAEMFKIELNDIEEIQESQITMELHSQKLKRRVQTEPQVYSPDLQDGQILDKIDHQAIKLKPHKQLVTKNSIINLLKRNSTELLRTKTDENEVNSRILNAHFIETNIKHTIYEKNYEFVSQINLQKLESRINNLYIELTRLNGANSEIICKFYEQSLGKKNKFNYDQRGLYSESENEQKIQKLSQQIKTFKSKKSPDYNSSSFDLEQYEKQFIKYKQKCEELRQLSKKFKISESISNWLPLKIQTSLSIVQPLKLEIQQINHVNGQVISYHWKKYRKPYSIIQFLKQKLKTQYDKVLTNNLSIDKNLETQIFKKKKFKKSLFVDNRKKINQLLLSSNVIYSKRESIFPVLKGIQQNYIKNSHHLNSIINQNFYALENPISIHKVLRSDSSQKKINNLSSKPVLSNNNKSKDQQKKFDSMKKILMVRENSERKYSQSQKYLQKLTDQERQKCDFLCKLSVKRETPKSMTNRNIEKHMQKYEKKSLVSMSKIMDLKSEGNKGQSISKTVQISTMTGKKLTVLNLS